MKQTKELRDRQVTWFENPKSTLSLAFNDESLYEVYVPTCSYRMGTSYIGYGAAVLGKYQTLTDQIGDVLKRPM